MNAAMDDGLLLGPSQTSEQATAAFRTALEDLGETQTSLAARMRKLNDRRPFSTILRGIQRMASGEARVSGEMQVLVELLGQQRRRAAHLAERLAWERDEHRNVVATDQGFWITLEPQTRGRWRVNVTNQRSGHSEPWPGWQNSLNDAKVVALVVVEEAIAELQRLGLQ